jgi:hypothetical protein
MSKKIKITEAQLRKIMESKALLNEFFDSPAPYVVERIKEQVMQMVVESLKEEGNEINGVSFDSLPDGLRAVTIDQIFYLLKEGIKRDMGLPTDGSDKEEEEEEPAKDMPGFEGTADALDKLSIREDDDIVNESINKMKSEFKRFL